MSRFFFEKVRGCHTLWAASSHFCLSSSDLSLDRVLSVSLPCTINSKIPHSSIVRYGGQTQTVFVYLVKKLSLEFCALFSLSGLYLAYMRRKRGTQDTSMKQTVMLIA